MKTARSRTARPSPSASTSGRLGKLLVYAPLALELITMLRRNQNARRGKYVKARKRDRAFDFLLGQAQRRLGGHPRGRRRF
ncbi:hypothetical protein [Deinococcus aerophilus]|uniref:Uncharacterized protein n=1 Tax=Deinococcus aerophilus TaxID=522488 RepID=A0ABQ2GML5_9DEIO|nr:hypothetical protein [Deinococcus aerophilus]GGM03956.1 hypothetical protein GCM10010841_10400 [Deinococcus aerophilus]